MRTINYWNQFLCTGRIEDYLAYREEGTEKPDRTEGADPDAGTGQCYRNDFKSGTGGGI